MNILLVDDDNVITENLSHALTKRGHQCFVADNGQTATELLNNNLIQVAFLDYALPDTNGLKILETIRQQYPQIICIMLTGTSTVQTAVDAIKVGAYDFLEKPYDLNHILVILDKVEKELTTQNKIHYLEEKLQDTVYDSIVGSSFKLKSTLMTLNKVASSNTFTVLIIGPSGTGKELLARYLHRKSTRASAPFVDVNCAAIPANLIESELFGYERGAFTGAEQSKTGLFENAHKGILFLDEIGEMPLEMQAKLLRALELRTIRRVGGSVNIPVDVAIIAATNKNLKDLVQQGKFREDLYYRLNIIEINSPSLAERREDIPVMIDHFIAKFNKLLGKKITGIAADALNLLYNYPLPGNVRELKNLLERAMILASTDILTVDLFSTITADSKKIGSDVPLEWFDENFSNYQNNITELWEKKYLQQLLQKTKGNVTQAAETAGLLRTSLSKLLSKYDISYLDFRE
jgi:two-component system response regulator AtoC